MFPLYFLAIIWLILLGIFIILATLTILQMLRYGINEPFTKYIILAFVIISLTVIVATLVALAPVNLKQKIDFSSVNSTFFAPQQNLEIYD